MRFSWAPDVTAGDEKLNYFPLRVFISQNPIYSSFISHSSGVKCENDGTATHTKTKIELAVHQCLIFFIFYFYQEPGLWNIKSCHLGGLLLNKTVVKNSSDHQQNTVVTFYIALRHLFYGFVRLQFHNSYTAVQSLPTILTILCRAYLSVCLWRQEPWSLPDSHLLQAVVYIFVCGYQKRRMLDNTKQCHYCSCLILVSCMS